MSALSIPQPTVTMTTLHKSSNDLVLDRTKQYLVDLQV